METRTLGSFIATLRKANGLTQKDLAEKLSVSDKAVSRWERDECAPDLTLIPVIADIFGVTTDELLRGQRNNPENPKPEQPTEKSRKQLNRILKENKTRFLTGSLIAVAVGFVGLIAAMICDLAFLRAYLGFYVGSAFVLIAGVMEIIFGFRAFSAVADDEDFEEAVVDAHRGELKKILKYALLVIFLVFSFNLPLVIHVYDAYWGLEFGSWLPLGLIYCAVTACLFIFGAWVFRGMYLRGMAHQEPSKVEHERKLHRLQAKFMGFTALAIVITLVLQLGVNALSAEYMPFSAGNTFQNIEDFHTWAMTNPEPNYDSVDTMEEVLQYFDEHGNEVSPEELREQTIHGTSSARIDAIITVSPRDIVMIRTPGSNSFPLTAYTHEDYIRNSDITDMINIFFILLYLGEIAAGVVLYTKKRKTV